MKIEIGGNKLEITKKAGIISLITIILAGSGFYTVTRPSKEEKEMQAFQQKIQQEYLKLSGEKEPTKTEKVSPEQEAYNKAFNKIFYDSYFQAFSRREFPLFAEKHPDIINAYLKMVKIEPDKNNLENTTRLMEFASQDKFLDVYETYSNNASIKLRSKGTELWNKADALKKAGKIEEAKPIFQEALDFFVAALIHGHQKDENGVITAEAASYSFWNTVADIYGGDHGLEKEVYEKIIEAGLENDYNRSRITEEYTREREIALGFFPSYHYKKNFPNGLE